MRTLTVALCLGSLGMASCSWTDSVTFSDFESGGLHFTQGDPPEGSTPVSIIYVAQSGWYLFAWIPFFVSAELPDVLRLMADEARRQGVDGVARIKAEMHPASLFTVWRQFVELTGETYRKR